MNDNNFFSIDRLVEFGMGMAMAKQMVDVMNNTMQQMYVPGSVQTIQKPLQASTYYVALNGQSLGPLNDTEISQMANSHQINQDTLGWVPGMSAWQPIKQIPSILKVIALTPPPLPKQ